MRTGGLSVQQKTGQNTRQTALAKIATLRKALAVARGRNEQTRRRIAAEIAELRRQLADGTSDKLSDPAEPEAG